jgi:hypothetical protein
VLHVQNCASAAHPLIPEHDHGQLHRSFFERTHLFTALGSTSSELGNMIRLDRLTGPLGHYEGFALMVAGIILILTGCFRFVRNERIIDSPNAEGSLGVRVELTVTAVLVLLVAAYCIAILTR